MNAAQEAAIQAAQQVCGINYSAADLAAGNPECQFGGFDKQADELAARFQPDYTPEQLENLGVYDALYRGQGPRLASLGEWKPEWVSEHDPKGWAQWYKRYASGRRIPEEDERQMKRWLSFKARHGGPFAKNPTARRGWALRNWGIDPSKLVGPEQANKVQEMLDIYKNKAVQQHLAERAKQSQHILVSGHSGAGKSTLTKALAEKLQLPYLQVDQQPEFKAFLANNTPENHLPVGSPKHEEFRQLLRETAQKTLQLAKQPSIIEGSQLAYLSPEVLGNFTRVHVNPSLRQAYQQRLERTKRRYLKDPEKEWTPDVEQEKRRTADMVYNFHRDAFHNYDKVPGTLKYKPGQDIKDLIAKITAAELAVRNSDRQIGSEKQSQTPAPAAKFIANADLMGSRGRAKMYGRPEPEGRDHDYIAFTDDVKQQKRFREMLTTLAQKHGYKLRQRPGGFLTASGNDTDLSFYPTAKRDDIHKAWALQEAGMSKDDAWAKIEAEKQAELLPEVQLQDHQQRIADRITDTDPRMLVYHGLGSGKSLSALAAAEAAKKKYQEDYGIVVPASLRGNFQKEVQKFTRNSNPEIMSYTGLGLGKKFQQQPDTVIMDEAHRLRNPDAASSRAAQQVAQNAKRLLLLTGSPVTNSPADLAGLLTMLENKQISPEEFEKRYVGYQKVSPGWFNWLRGIKPGEKPYVKNEQELRGLLQGKVDYQPSKTPEGVNVNEEVVRVPLSAEQQKIQKAIRTKIPPGFLWKLDQEFPLSRDELAKLNSFLTGLRQVSLSTQPFRADKDPGKAFGQSSKLQTAMKNLQQVLDSDPRKKAIIYSNFIDSGLKPYSAALEKAKIPHGIFHGSIPVKQRLQALKEYNEGKLRALLLGPAAAEGISTKGTSLIQLLDPHWHESRSQQARGRGLRFDSHAGLPEELKNVAVQRYLSSSQDPSWLGKLLGYQRERTGDEILEKLTADKEQLNEEFRRILREIGAEKKGTAVVMKKKKQKPPQSTPLFVPALKGLGLLSLGAAYGLGTDKHFDELDQALKLESTPLSDNETAMSRYADVMAVGARSTPLGVPISKLLSAARTNPAFLKQYGIGENYATLGPGARAEATMHYDLFGRGPIAAYHHMLTEARPDWKLSPAATAFVNSQQPDAAKQPSTRRYAETYAPRFMSAYRKWMDKQKSPGGLMEGASGWLQPKDVLLRDVPHEKQVEFLRDYVGSLPKELREEETRLHAASLNQNKNNYLPLFRNAVGARKLMKELGVGLGAAAGGGMAGHLLYRNLVNKKKQTTLGNYLAAAAGSGIGGGAGYLFGSQHGQELLAKLLSRVATQKSSG